jgi:hypothetical protein
VGVKIGMGHRTGGRILYQFTLTQQESHLWFPRTAKDYNFRYPLYHVRNWTPLLCWARFRSRLNVSPRSLTVHCGIRFHAAHIPFAKSSIVAQPEELNLWEVTGPNDRILAEIKLFNHVTWYSYLSQFSSNKAKSIIFTSLNTTVLWQILVRIQQNIVSIIKPDLTPKNITRVRLGFIGGRNSSEPPSHLCEY